MTRRATGTIRDFRLERRVQIADFIEEEDAAVGRAY
jgi:hypothetical protein